MVRRMTTSVLILATLIAASVGVGSAAPRAAAGLAPTQVIHVSPVTSKGALKPDYTISRHVTGGTCEAGSDETNNAYRCFFGRGRHARVIDPCWAEADHSEVVCLLAPYSFKVVELDVKTHHGFDNTGFSKRVSSQPWGVQLTNGVQCVFQSGASVVVKGKRVSYGCGHAKYVLAGNVNKHGKVWTIHKATSSHSGHFTLRGRVNLSTAWFGKASRKG
jgi:hypothetical protein